MRVNKKMKRGAIRSALTDALQSGKLAVIDELSFDGPKTADAARLLRALELDGKVLLVLAEPHDTVERSFRNIASVRIAYAPSLGVYEKSYSGIEQNTYTFLVDKRSNKTEIKEAVQKIWDVRVTSVNTLNRKGKTKRRRMTVGKQSDQKRAIVTLAEGDAIEIFETGK